MADLLTTNQVINMLHVDRTTIYRMVEDGRLPAVRVGKQWRFPKDILERWLAAQATASASLAMANATGASADTVLAGADAAIARTSELAAAPLAGTLAELLPLACVQMVQDAFADLLGVMLIVTHMDGQPVTRASNPHGFFRAISMDQTAAQHCFWDWCKLADTLALDPRMTPGECGLLWTRGLIRVGSELKGMLVGGGLAPEMWPPAPAQVTALAEMLGLDREYIAAHIGAVHYVDAAGQARLLAWIQRIADIVSQMVQDRGVPPVRLQAISLISAQAR
jgi:excisionase family DNA binding protein